MNDLRFAFRQLLKNPGFTAVAVLTLALGIGANTAIFTLIDAVLLKTLPVQNPEELVLVAHAGKQGSSSRSSNYPMYEFFRDQNVTLSDLLAYWHMEFKVRTGEGVQRVRGQFVTLNFFSTLGIRASLGRTFANEDQPDSTVAVITDRYWQGNFARANSAVGQTLVVNGKSLTIIGVTSPEFYGLEPGSPVDIIVPLALQPSLLPEFGNRLTMGSGWWSLGLMGRLKPGISTTQAKANLDVLLRQWLTDSQVPEATIERSFARVELESGSKGLDALRRRFSRPLRVLGAAVGLVLLIACGNIANLLLARTAQRRKELALRMAIGASRGRLVRQLLTEGILLAGLGGTAGVLFGWWGSHLLVVFASSGPVRMNLNVQPDLRVLGFTGAVSLLTGIIVSVWPAWRSTRFSLTPALKENPASAFSTARVSGKILVGGQVALSLCLVTGAVLFAFSLRNILALGAGFRLENLLFVSFDPSGTGYDRVRLKTFFHDALERVRRLPGVSAASLSSLAPLSSDDTTWSLNVPGFVASHPDDQAVHINTLSSAYFETMGIPLLAGREFSDRDATNAPPVCVINETLKRSYFSGTDPIGKTVQIGRDPAAPRIEIVGVVKDSKREDLRGGPERTLYLPSLQQNGLPMTLEARISVTPSTVQAALRQAVAEVSRDIPIHDIKTAQAQLESGLVQERLIATLSSCFAALALLLAAVGLYGTLSNLVTRKTSEIGVRMALGARRAHVFRLVIGEAAWPVLAGVVIGSFAALAAGRLVAGMLFGIRPVDPAVLGLSIAVLVAVAAIAVLLPARRATRVDPMEALRYE